MLLSLALIFLCGLLLGSIFQRLKMPGLLGMLIGGIILGPYVLALLDDSILSISADLRQLALIIILARAGLSLDLNELRAVGRPAILLCFVPACFEILGMVILAPPLLGIDVLDAAIMGAVVAAVSPAVVVPKMLMLMQEGYGKKQGIPQMIMAGASVDDVFVIVLFTAFTGLAQGQSLSAASFAQIPVSIVTGILAGILCGLLLARLFTRMHIRDTVKVLIFFGIACLLVAAENLLKAAVPFSGLLSVMSLGATLYAKHRPVASRLAGKFAKLWVAAEIMLFVLVGATIDVGYALDAGFKAIVLILAAICFRMAGVYVSLIKTKLTMRERLFCMIAYCPKATVQAALGSIPLGMGLASGQIILTVAVLAILLTAPLGALGIDRTYRRLLTKA